MQVRLDLLGKAAVHRNGSPGIDIPPSLQPFLGYLGVERPSSCHRERLIDALWPQLTPDQGRRRLNTVVWRARALFGGAREVVHTSRAGHITLARGCVEVDVTSTLAALSDENRSAAAHADPEALARLQQAVLADAEEFLVGCYHDWVVQARQQLHLALIAGIETLLATAKTAEEAMFWAERLVQRDPLREDTHRRLIRLYSDAGRRTDALRQFEVCERRLRDDLGVEPLIETTLAAMAVREGVRPLEVDHPDPVCALREMQRALASCRLAVERIESAITSLSTRR
ncbi:MULTISPECIES: AfsR/SARP family transcriptional regulator [unclassified Geodermatophilus]|uniref:AfsR/SARP family transcriptional regulator n=1 Tax=unclassified Geodermatophilus TaxID=2637632 RepID=UPI003EE97B48